MAARKMTATYPENCHTMAMMMDSMMLLLEDAHIRWPSFMAAATSTPRMLKRS